MDAYSEIILLAKENFANKCEALLENNELSSYWDVNNEREWLNTMEFFEQHDVLNYSDFLMIFKHRTGVEWDDSFYI